MFMYKVLISEILAVDWLPSGTIPMCNVSSLNHEPWDDPMENAPFIVERLPTDAYAFLPSAEASEVFCCFGHICIEL